MFRRRMGNCANSVWRLNSTAWDERWLRDHRGVGSAVLGTLVPLFVGQRTLVSNAELVRILAGVVVMVLGIALTPGVDRLTNVSEQRKYRMGRNKVM